MRIIPKYRNKISVPEKYRKFLRDYPDGYTPLETLILRVPKYGKFEDIKWIYQQHPNETYYAAFLYKIHKWGKDDVKKDFEKKIPDQSFEIYISALLNFEDYGEIEDRVEETLLELIEK